MNGEMMLNINDKVLHFGAGFLIAVIVTLLTAPIYGALIGALAGFGKELFDKYIQEEQFDFFDLFVTILGAWTGVMVLYLVESFIL